MLSCMDTTQSQTWRMRQSELIPLQSTITARVQYSRNADETGLVSTCTWQVQAVLNKTSLRRALKRSLKSV